LSIITSLQLSARPIDVDSSASLEDIRDAAWGQRFRAHGQNAPEGWGSTLDAETYLDMPPRADMQIHQPSVIAATDRLPRRLRLRYYWTQTDRRALQQNNGSNDWRLVNVLHATDVIFYESGSGTTTALVTSRTPIRFNKVAAAVRVLLGVIDDAAQVTADQTSASLTNDFFLWLFYRNQTSRNLSDQGLQLQGMSALSSTNMNKAARFKDGATLDRIELISLIAVSAGKFGPAKFSVSSDVPDATFDLELHLDGGFQPYRTSDYEDVVYDRTALGPALFDDIWVSALPALREAYSADHEWSSTGQAELSAMCVRAVRSALSQAMSLSDEMDLEIRS
jgi:hypothetical protein